MYHHARGYELRQRLESYGGVPGRTGAAGRGPPERTVGGAVLLSVFPMAFVAAASYPAVATVVLALTAVMFLGGRHLPARRLGRIDRDPGPDAAGEGVVGITAED